jgi:hypothetical protein
MVNIEKITSTLAKLPDESLQRYAMMHKDDPYIVALAISESNRRKDMRSASQVQPMQQQPKVVDQAVAEMAAQQMPSMPEEQGIGALPVQMNFAEGGITGYASGGEVERYQDRGLVRPYETPYDRMNRENREAAAIAKAREEARAASMGVMPYAEQMSRLGSSLARIPGKVFDVAGDAAKTLVSAPGTSGNTALSNLIGSPDPVAAPAAQVQYDPNQATRRSMYEKPDEAGRVQVPSLEQLTRKTPSLSGSTSLPATGKTAQQDEGLEAMQKRLMSDVNQKQAGLMGQRQGIVDETQAFRDKRMADYEAELEKRGDVFKPREERIFKREKELEGMGDKYMGLALLQAGAAMMSTPGGIGAALGKGISVGSERYVAGMDKINAAKEKFAEARDKLDELRIGREDLTSAERRKLKGEADGAKLEGKKFLYEGAVSDLGVERKDVDSLFGALAREQQSKQEMASRENIARMQEAGAASRAKAQLEATLSAPDRLAFQSYLAKTVTKENPLGDPSKAYEAMLVAKQEPKSIQQLKHDWSTDVMLQNKYKDVNDYINFMSGSGATSGAGAPPPGAVRLKTPGG